MTRYRYKEVSVLLMGELDTKAIRRAENRGWTPVPDSEIPQEFLLAGPGRHALRLYRMSEVDAVKEETERHRLNMIEADPRTHIARANAAIRGYVEELNAEHGRDDAGGGWSQIESSGTIRWAPEK